MKTLRTLALIWALALITLFTGPALADRTLAQSATPIFYDKAVTATLGGGQSTNYTFTGKAGDKLTLTMNAIGGDIHPLLDLYDPQNRLIAEDDHSGGKGNAFLQGIVLPATGTYKLVASNKQPSGSTGKYSLIISSSPIQTTVMNYEGPANQAELSAFDAVESHEYHVSH